MTTVLVISDDDALRARWATAARNAGHDVLEASALLPGVDLLGAREVDGLLADARAHGALELLAAVSAYRPMPPTVIVHDRDLAPPARMRVVACRSAAATPPRLVFLLGRLLSAGELARPTNLPLRVTPMAAKWTSRLSTPSDDPCEDSAEIRRSFDGETNDELDLTPS
jgi:hypothetical protein